MSWAFLPFISAWPSQEKELSGVEQPTPGLPQMWLPDERMAGMDAGPSPVC
jgi:hypothetical protein